MVQGREEKGSLIISLSGQIDSSNAPQVEKEIRELWRNHRCSTIELDCDRLKYVSSAGLRVILRLIQDTEHTRLINVHTELYEIMDLTGFTELAEVKKAYRTISVEGCEVIGEGAYGKVYRIDPDTIVKVYPNPDALQDIHRGRELSRLAFVEGVPTAIPYDVVRIEGGGHGSVFELLNAVSYAGLIIKGEKTPDEVAELSINLLKRIHSKEVHSEILPPMKNLTMDRAAALKGFLAPEEYEKLIGLIAAVPEDAHLVHGDYHLKNIMMQNGESLLIDMDTLGYGHPVFELEAMYNAYVGYGLADPGIISDFLGISAETAHAFWRRSLELYLGTRDAAAVNAVEEKVKVISLMRIMRHEIRRDGLNRENGRRLIGLCRAGLAELLPRVATLTF